MKIRKNISKNNQHFSFSLQFMQLGLLLLVGILGITIYNLWAVRTSPKNFDECIVSSDSKIHKSYPQTCVSRDGRRYEQSVSIPSQMPTPDILQANKLIESIRIKGWKHFENKRFSIELPSDWLIIGNAKDNASDFTIYLTDTIYGRHGYDGIENSIHIGIDSIAYQNMKWIDSIQKNTFFDLSSNLWLDGMRKSGGGGILHTTIELDQLAGFKVVKRTNTWTQSTEGVDAVSVNYFFPDTYAKELRVWEISYRLPKFDDNLAKRRQVISNILSTFTLKDSTKNAPQY